MRKEILLPAEFQSPPKWRGPGGLHPFHDQYHILCLIVHGHGGFWYSANTLPFRKLEHWIDFKPLILTNTPGKLRSSEIKYLD